MEGDFDLCVGLNLNLSIYLLKYGSEPNPE